MINVELHRAGSRWLPYSGDYVCTHTEKNDFHINKYIDKSFLFIHTPFLLDGLSLIYIMSSSAFLRAGCVCFVWRYCVCWGGQNGKQVQEHLPLWWGPWSGSRSAMACVGCTVMSWQWSAETAAQPRPPRVQHRTSVRRPSAERRGGQSVINVEYSTRQIRQHSSVHNQRNINIMMAESKAHIRNQVYGSASFHSMDTMTMNISRFPCWPIMHW